MRNKSKTFLELTISVENKTKQNRKPAGQKDKERGRETGISILMDLGEASRRLIGKQNEEMAILVKGCLSDFSVRSGVESMHQCMVICMIYFSIVVVK